MPAVPGYYVPTTGATNMTPSPAGYYVRTSSYVGAPKGNVVSIDAGRYLLQKGTPDTPDRTVFTLQSNTSDNLESYLLQGDSLVPLDSDGNPSNDPINHGTAPVGHDQRAYNGRSQCQDECTDPQLERGTEAIGQKLFHRFAL